MSELHRVAIVAGARTPFAKALTALKDLEAVDLGSHAVTGLLDKSGIDPEAVDELHYGLVVVDPRVPHLAREVAFRTDLPATTRAVTYTDNCVTGTTAITALADRIRLGRVEVGIAGGVESMSNVPILWSTPVRHALRDSQIARSLGQRLSAFSGVRPGDLLPSLPGVAEPSTGLTMGEHCELMVKEWGIDRETQDRIALRSHHTAAAATDDGRLLAEIHPLGGLDRDNLVRRDTSLEKLAKLKPVFDRSAAGTLTAGNSSALTDGASAVLLMQEARARAEGREILAFVEDAVDVAIHPDDGLLMGPGVAVPRLLRKHGLTLDDLDLIEMHEAFAGQIACNLAAWRDGWKEEAIGEVDEARLNVLGGSLAVGHPFAATGGRIVTTLAHELARRGGRYGLISICAAGAQAVAMLLRRPEA